MFAPIIGRAGRHGGRCWEGSFPTVEQARAEAKRLRELAERRRAAQRTEPDADEQTRLEL
jgi:hypothetical protein